MANIKWVSGTDTKLLDTALNGLGVDSRALTAEVVPAGATHARVQMVLGSIGSNRDAGGGIRVGFVTNQGGRYDVGDASTDITANSEAVMLHTPANTSAVNVGDTVELKSAHNGKWWLKNKTGQPLAATGNEFWVQYGNLEVV